MRKRPFLFALMLFILIVLPLSINAQPGGPNTPGGGAGSPNTPGGTGGPNNTSRPSTSNGGRAGGPGMNGAAYSPSIGGGNSPDGLGGRGAGEGTGPGGRGGEWLGLGGLFGGGGGFTIPTDLTERFADRGGVENIDLSEYFGFDTSQFEDLEFTSVFDGEDAQQAYDQVWDDYYSALETTSDTYYETVTASTDYALETYEEA
nr:hypothetical protein [Anaerolineae bacterium]